MAAIERSRGETSFIDVLDRVLDKGIVIDGWARVSLIGVDLMTIDGWAVVASIQTYLQYADSLGLPEEAADITVNRTSSDISVSADYAERVELPLFVRQIRFSPRARGPL